MSQKRANLTKNLRSIQGQSDTHEVCGKAYVYQKLTGRRAQVTLKSLVSPFVQAAVSIMEAVQGISLKDIVSGRVDVDLSKLDIAQAAKALDALSEEDYWKLAQRILNDVEIDGESFGKLKEDTPYYDDKHLEFVKAIAVGVQVNYPFVGALIQTKKAGSTDSSPKNESENDESDQ